jgi:hypothetical protein
MAASFRPPPKAGRPPMRASEASEHAWEEMVLRATLRNQRWRAKRAGMAGAMAARTTPRDQQWRAKRAPRRAKRADVLLAAGRWTVPFFSELTLTRSDCAFFNG